MWKFEWFKKKKKKAKFQIIQQIIKLTQLKKIRLKVAQARKCQLTERIITQRVIERQVKQMQSYRPLTLQVFQIHVQGYEQDLIKHHPNKLILSQRFHEQIQQKVKHYHQLQIKEERDFLKSHPSLVKNMMKHIPNQAISSYTPKNEGIRPFHLEILKQAIQNQPKEEEITQVTMNKNQTITYSIMIKTILTELERQNKKAKWREGKYHG